MDRVPLTRESVETARRKISPYVHKTPVLTSSTINELASYALRMQASETLYDDSVVVNPSIEIFFKCENFQKGGAFKARGAFFNVMSLSEEVSQKGVCTHSSGNHSQALALAAKTRGIPAYVVMPSISTPSKIAATKGYGADVHFSGNTSSEREAVLKKVQKDTGATFIPPYDYVGTILGQGTVGLELEQQVQQIFAEKNTPADLDAIVAPLGGGGLLGGIATALSGQRWNGHPALIYGAEPSHEGADDARRGLAENPPTRVEHVSSLTIADGLRTPVGKLNWSVISDKSKVAAVYSVTDDQIRAALKILFERLKIWVEPSSAVPLAIVLYDKSFHEECLRRMQDSGTSLWRLGLVLSGGNTTTDVIVSLYSHVEPSTSALRAEGK